MILLDTNVLAELMRPAPEPAAEHRLAAQPDASVFIGAVTGASLATRNVPDFGACGVAVLDPWQAGHAPR